MPKIMTKQTEVFTIDELLELYPDAAERAHEDYLASGDYYAWGSDNEATLNAFAKLFPVEIISWSYGDYSGNNGVSWHHLCMDGIEDLRGIRLYKYLWNNYGDTLFPFKTYYHRTSGKKRRSKCLRYPGDGWGDLTGYCRDGDILDPIYKFMRNPIAARDTTFEDILNDCVQSWAVACNQDVEESQSQEYFIDMARGNDWLFTKDGDFYS